MIFQLADHSMEKVEAFWQSSNIQDLEQAGQYNYYIVKKGLNLTKK